MSAYIPVYSPALHLGDIIRNVTGFVSQRQELQQPPNSAYQDIVAKDLLREFLTDFATSESEKDESLSRQDIEKQIIDRVSLLQDFVSDVDELITLRACAARIYIKITHDFRQLRDDNFIENVLLKSSSLMLRMGVLMGYGDSKDVEKLKYFLNDPHSAIAEEAEEILEDLDG